MDIEESGSSLSEQFMMDGSDYQPNTSEKNSEIDKSKMSS